MTFCWGQVMSKDRGLLRIRLRFNSGTVGEKTFDQEQVIIGRDPGCDVVIDNRLVSGRHARVVRRPEGYFLEDLGSTNGTVLGGKKITAAPLTSGAVATIGRHEVEFIEEGESSGAHAAPRAAKPPLSDATICYTPAEQRHLVAETSLQVFLASGGKLGTLILEKGDALQTQLELRQEITMVGKDAQAAFRLKGLLLPNVAFYVERGKDRYELVPPEDSGKVSLNGEKVEYRMPLKDRDLIGVGGVALRFRTV